MKIAIGGSAANPPHFGHKKLVEAVMATNLFDHVVWTVSGDRPDKPGMMPALYRWEMGKLLFGEKNGLSVLYEAGPAIPTTEVLSRARVQYPSAEIVWYCGADHFLPRKQFGGMCDVLGFWDDGATLFLEQEFLIVERKGIDMSALQLPKNYSVINADIPEISSTQLRNRIEHGVSVEGLTASSVAGYIKENEIYVKELCVAM